MINKISHWSRIFIDSRIIRLNRIWVTQDLDYDLLNSTKLYKSYNNRSSVLIRRIFRNLFRTHGFENIDITRLNSYVAKRLDILARNYGESSSKGFEELPPYSLLLKKPG